MYFDDCGSVGLELEGPAELLEGLKTEDVIESAKLLEIEL